MNDFMNSTLSDIRNGRQSWRVMVTLSLPAFVVAFANTLLQGA